MKPKHQVQIQCRKLNQEWQHQDMLQLANTENRFAFATLAQKDAQFRIVIHPSLTKQRCLYCVHVFVNGKRVLLPHTNALAVTRMLVLERFADCHSEFALQFAPKLIAENELPAVQEEQCIELRFFKILQVKGKATYYNVGAADFGNGPVSEQQSKQSSVTVSKTQQVKRQPEHIPDQYLTVSIDTTPFEVIKILYKDELAMSVLQSSVKRPREALRMEDMTEHDVAAYLAGAITQFDASPFVQHRVTGKGLQLLTADMLREMGIQLVGQRTRILHEIEQLYKQQENL